MDELVAWDERVRGCNDLQLMAELQLLARRDRRCEVRVLMYLAEVDERRLFLGQGFSCLFRYATAVLRMSEQQAYLRIQAARLARRFPVVLEMLAEGAVNLSTLKLLDQHLTDDNHLALLERARNKTKREVELLVAEIAPKPDVPNLVRRLPAPAQSPRPHGHDAQQLSVMPVPTVTADAQVKGEAAISTRSENAKELQHAGDGGAPDVAPAKNGQRSGWAFALEAPRASCTPLGPGRFKLQMTTSQSVRDKLTQLQHLLRHQVTGGDLAVIVELALDGLLEKKLKQRFAQVSKPRAAVKSNAMGVRAQGEAVPAGPLIETERTKSRKAQRRAKGRYIPRAVVREVFAHDGEQCTFISPDGQRCSERGMLERHHVRAFALGGEATSENIKITCRAHNGFYADQDFGAAHMQRKRAASKPRASCPA